MRFCIDTRLLEAIASNDNLRKELLRNLISNPHNQIYLPSICITEFVKESLRQRKKEITFMALDDFLSYTRPYPNFFLEKLETETSNFHLKCDFLISDHDTFRRMHYQISKKEKLKIKLKW